MLVELLRPAGPDLARRWLAALLVVPREDREAVVEAVERRVAAIYPLGPGVSAEEVTVIHPPRQGDGCVEQVEVTYRREKAGEGRVRKSKGA